MIEEGRASPSLLGGYQVLRKLKAGGMGEVVLARRRGPGGFERLAAIKTIRPELDDNSELRRMFLDEAQLLARLTHAAIAQIYDFGEEDGRLFLAMEYVPGVRFRDLIDRREPPPALCARAMAEVCRGLHAVHQLHDIRGTPLGVVHRDVSPDNLMLSFTGQVKILDFGIALMRGRQTPVTEFGIIKGKPPYLSPEQLNNGSIDGRTDVFAAALVMHEMLTGQRVFRGASVLEVARAIEDSVIDPPSALAGPLPDGLDEAVMRGVARKPDERWQTASDFAQALDRVVESAGTESLEEYARRALSDDRARHDDWLAGILSTHSGEGAIRDAPGPPAGRPTGQVTVPDSNRALRELAATEPAISEIPVDHRRRRVTFAVCAAVLLSGATALATWQLSRSTSQVHKGVAVSPDAGAALAIHREAPASSRPDSPLPGLRPAAEQPADAGAPAIARGLADADAGHGSTNAAQAPDSRASDRRRRHSRVRRSAGEEQVPAAAGSGQLTIVAHPYAEVQIDGVHIGTTPILGRVMAAGEHEVVLKDPASGQVRLRRQVHVYPDKRTKVTAPPM